MPLHKMEDLYWYFIRNFFLLCVAFGVIFMVLRSYKAKKVAIAMPIAIVASAVSLSIAFAFEQYAGKHPEHVVLATFCFFSGMALRPLIIYFFMRITVKRRWVLNIALLLIIINAIVYSFSLFRFAPDFAKIVYWYDATGPKLVYNWGPLYFFSYFIVGILMTYLIVHSLYSLKGRHRYDALASLISVVFILISVLLETLNPSLVEYGLLNTTIAISCLFYVVHLYQQAANRDGLTQLYDRKTYYVDVAKLGSRVRGVILIDMNSLKLINDTQGHEAGDNAIITIARTLEKCSDRHSMYIYRMGGDEFLLLSTSRKPDSLEKVAQAIQDEMAKTPYSVSLGWKYREDDETPTEALIKEAEVAMYANKAAYYKASGLERRKHYGA